MSVIFAGFINFTSDPEALMAMHKLNGKIIPNSTPVSKKLHLKKRGQRSQKNKKTPQPSPSDSN